MSKSSALLWRRDMTSAISAPGLEAAGFEEIVTYEHLVWDSPVSYDRARVRDLFALHWLTAKEN